MLDFRIETFFEVCKYMNFTKAAQSLNITQPAVSQHIKYLEELYHVKLFTFFGKKMYLSQYGKILLNTATTVKHDEMYMKQKFSDISCGAKTVKLGVTLTIGEYVLPKSLANILKKSKNQKISVTIENTAKLLAKLNNGEIDCAVVEGYFEKKEYDYKVYSCEEFIGVCSPQNIICKKEYVTLEELFAETLILREVGSGSREIFERFLQEKNYSTGDFSNIISISNIQAIKTLVEQNCGITFLYKAAAEEELKKSTLHQLNISGSNLKHDFTFIWRKGSVFADDYIEMLHKLKQ